MSWASRYIIDLREGRMVEFRPRGNSMSPMILDNELVRVIPFQSEDDGPEQGDVVLCTVSGRQYLHLVKAVNGDRYLIGNNRGGLNGWTHRKHLHGILAERERDFA
jgi:hypothetical protein